MDERSVAKSRPKLRTKAACNIGVDLTHMIPGGENGGLKPAILAFLQVLEDEHAEALRFTFLTSSRIHNELLWLVRAQDLMLCIERTPGDETSLVKTPTPNVQLAEDFQPSLLKQLDVDVLYCPFGPTNRSIPEIPTISLIADLLHRDYPFSISRRERTWREDYFRRLLFDVDYVQCISNYTVSRLLDHYPLPKERVFCTYLPIAQRLARNGSTSIGKKPFFIYPANFWTHKNHEALLIAYRLYRHSSNDPWDLVLTGHCDERAEQLKRLAMTLGMERNVHFRGHLREKEFAELFGQAGALVYPSLHEGFGIPLVEAMRLGKPIICGHYASIPEITGSAAFSVNAKDPKELALAMKRVAEDGNLRTRLVCSGEERLAEFSISKEVAKLSEVLLAARKKNTKFAVFRRYLARCERERRRLAAGLGRRLYFGGRIAVVLERVKAWLYLRQVKVRRFKSRAWPGPFFW